MKIGLVQMNIIWEDMEANMEKARQYFKEAAAGGVSLLVFPEMAFTGFSMNVDTLGVRWTEQVDFMKQMTKQYKISAVFSCIVKEKDWDKAHNDLFFVEEGEIIMRYTKIHPFSFGREAKYYEGGDKIRSARWKGTTVGAFICYDLRFGDVFKISAEKNPVIIVVANWPKTRILHWDRLLQARAIENQSYIIGVNRTGREPSLCYNGHSAVYGPDGALLTEITEDEKMVTAKIEADLVWQVRESFNVRADRREELYQNLRETES